VASPKWNETQQCYIARYYDLDGRQHMKRFPKNKKRDAQSWLDAATADLVKGTYLSPQEAKMTVAEWCDLWLDTYGGRTGTVRAARTHINHIRAGLGDVPLAKLKPTAVRVWVKRLKACGYADSFVYAIYSRLSQILTDAVLDGRMTASPCSRRIAPPMGKPKPYVATPEQVWVLYDAMPDHFRPAILLGGFAGLRIGEAVGLRVSDVDFLRRLVTPAFQHDGQPLKTEGSGKSVSIPADLAMQLSVFVQRYGGEFMVTDELGRGCGSWMVERALRSAKKRTPGLPERFSFHDFRHFYASMLIDGGAKITKVQHQMRHDSPVTTLRLYSHLFPDDNDQTTDIVARAMRRAT
jgi:integrase